jgi:hypothetical protein
MSQRDDAEHWRAAADEVRMMAEQATTDLKRRLLSVAEAYMGIAAATEEFARTRVES